MDNIFKLIKKQLNNDITTAEDQILKSWYDNSLNNRRIYTCYYATLKLIQIKKNENRFKTCVIPAYYRISKIINGKEPHANKKQIYVHIIYAASIILAVGIGYLINQTIVSSQLKNDSSTQCIKIAYGSKSAVTLPDGTQVWLNSGSKLEYPGNFGRTNRNVTLTGEAYFEVTKNKKLPFRVTSGKIAINVLGTKFNMKAYPEDEKARITLVEGSLAVENQKKTNGNILLKPNQQAIINNKDEKVQVRNVVASNYTMWTTSDSKGSEISTTIANNGPAPQILPKVAARNILFFDEEPLSQIAKDLERAFNVNIEIEDKNLIDKHFYGDFRNEETITDILKIIAEKNNLCYIIEGDTIQILQKNFKRKHTN